MLSDNEINEFLKSGEIVIDPFDRNNLNNTSYDVTLGEFYYVEKQNESLGFFNPYSEKDVKGHWELMQAKELSYWKKNQKEFEDYIIHMGRRANAPVSDSLLETIVNNAFENISEDEKIIIIFPHQNLLGHTQEYIGGKTKVSTKMMARSSMGRNNVTFCRDAGKGDVGYTNKWTMEITNNNGPSAVPLVVGSRVAQIEFYEAKDVLRNYTQTGHYNQVNEWKPEDMLPKLYLNKRK